MIVTLSLLLVVATLIYSFYRNTYNYWSNRDVPNEKPLPILGNLRGVGSTKHFSQIHQELYKKFKGQAPFAGMFTFMERSALLIDLELIKHVLIKDFNNFLNRGLFSNVEDDPLTGHLFLLENDEWRSLRHKLTPVFTAGKLRQLVPAVAQVGERLEKAIETELSRKQADADIVEFKELCARFTTDVIGVCAFGLECNSLQDPDAEFRKMGRELFQRSRHPRVLLFFILMNPDVSRKLHLKILPDDLSEFFLTTVRKTVDYRLKNNIKRDDFIDMLIEMRADDDMQTKTGIDLSEGLTFLQIAAQCFVFFVAGFETSSSTMSFALHELAQHEEIQTRLRAEIEEVLKAHKGVLSYEAIKAMTYLEKVVSETLRLHPILPQLQRKTVNNYTVPNSSMVIERGTTVIIPVKAIHTDPTIYPEPERFDPERFTPEAIQARHSCAYLPFGDGPRNCIGLRFGKIQTKIGLISLLRRYKISVSERTEIPLKLNTKVFVLNAQNGVHLRVTRL